MQERSRSGSVHRYKSRAGRPVTARFCRFDMARLTARRLSPALAIVRIGSHFRAPVVALGSGCLGPRFREEVFLHLADDAIRDLALTATIPTAQEQRSVACPTCPDQRLILH